MYGELFIKTEYGERLLLAKRPHISIHLKSLCLGQQKVKATKPMGENQQDVYEIHHSPEVRPNRSAFDDVIETNGAIHLRVGRMFKLSLKMIYVEVLGNIISGLSLPCRTWETAAADECRSEAAANRVEEERPSRTENSAIAYNGWPVFCRQTPGIAQNV